MDGIFRPWADLPQEIVEIIISKLRFLNQNPAQRFRDLIRTLAVCKSWRDCKDFVSNLDILPCAVVVDRENVILSGGLIPKQIHSGGPIKKNLYGGRSEKESGGYKYTIIGQLFDPHSQNVSKVENSIETPEKLSIRVSYGLASKNGWLLQRVNNYDWTSSVLTMYHPFANHIILLPKFVGGRCVKAAMKADPSSPVCEIFLITNRGGDVLITTLCRSRGYEGQSKIVEKGEPNFFPMPKHDFVRLESVLYMKGNIYCLFENGELYSYGVEDKSWKFLAKQLPEGYKLCSCWLVEINENIIMVCSFLSCQTMMIFRFDWSKMSWVVETSLKSCAIYISEDIAFSTSLTNYDGKKLEGCVVFYENLVFVVNSDVGFIQSDEYGWIRSTASFCLVDPPWFV